MPATIPSQMTDAQLAGAYQQTGNSAYLGELYTRYYNNVFAYCIRFTQDREGALDISQEAFLRAAERITQLRNAEFFGGWLFRIVRNECIDFIKARSCIRHFTFSEESLLEWNEDPFSTDAAKEKEQLLTAMQTAIEDLDQDSQTLLKQKYLEGQPITELQHRYGLSESAVKMRLARARKRVQSRMVRISAAARQQVA